MEIGKRGAPVLLLDTHWFGGENLEEIRANFRWVEEFKRVLFLTRGSQLRFAKRIQKKFSIFANTIRDMFDQH